MFNPLFINETGTMGQVIMALVNNVGGGDIFLSLMLIIMIISVFCLAVGLPFEFGALIILPLIVVCYAFVPDFIAITGVLALYLAVLVSKNFILT